mgnify:CR=1 FL=1
MENHPRNPVTFVTAGLLLVIFILMLFAFQVRTTEVAVVTTFGRISRSLTEPHLYFRWPWPIQSVYKFDNRVQNFERKFEETTTRDAINLLVTVFAGWKVADPERFLQSLNGDPLKAEQNLEPLIRTAKNGVLGQTLFSELISTNQAELKFNAIESQMLASVQSQARETYGIDVLFLGLKQLGLPQSITTKVFDRMKAERQTRVRQFQTEGERDAQIIRAQADNLTRKTLADARATAIEITGSAEAKASEYYRVLQQNPDLANFLFQRNALEQALKDRATLILDQQTPPFSMMQGMPATSTNPPARR